MAVLKIFDLNGKIPASAGLPSKVTSSLFISPENRPITIGLGFAVKTVTFGGELKQRKAHIVTIPGTGFALSRQRSWDVIVNTSIVKTMEKAVKMLTPASTESPHLQYETADGKQVSPIIFYMRNSEWGSGRNAINYTIEASVSSACAKETEVFNAGSMLPGKNGAPAFWIGIKKIHEYGVLSGLRSKTKTEVTGGKSFTAGEQNKFLSWITDVYAANTRGFPLENRLWVRHSKGKTILGPLSRDVFEKAGNDSLGYFADTHKCDFTYNETATAKGEGSLARFKEKLLSLEPGEKKVLCGEFGRTKKIFMERLREPTEKGEEYSAIFIQDEPLASHIEKALPYLQEGKPYIIQQGDRLLKIDANTKPAKYTAAHIVNLEISKFTVREEGDKLAITGFDDLMKS